MGAALDLVLGDLDQAVVVVGQQQLLRLPNDKVDVVWEPMESLYSVEKTAPMRWDSGTPPQVAETKLNELFLPDGVKP